MRKMTLRIAAGLALLAIGGLAAGAAYQAVATWRDQARYPPPGQLVDVGGYRLHIHCRGEGSPTVIIDSGLGNWSIFWSEVQAQIAQVTRVCAYDRAGYGWSEPGAGPRTSELIVSELHSLLANAGIEPPYVLVGHSFGGYNARVFAHQYPAEVVGMALVESAHPQQWSRLPAEVERLLDSQAGALHMALPMSRVGLVRLTVDGLPSLGLPQDARPGFYAVMARPEIYEAMIAEVESVSISEAQVLATEGLGAMPLAVVTARNSFGAFVEASPALPLEEANRVWLELQRELAALSTHSFHFVSDTGRHYIQLDDPQLVSNAILRVVAEAGR